MSQPIQQNQNKNKKNQGSPWAILVVLLIFALRAMRSGNYGTEAVPVILAVFAVIAAGIAIAKSAAKKRGDGAKTPAAAPVRKSPSVELHRPVPSMQRREPVTAQRPFPQPEAYCVSCELSGEDHFVRDRQRRIAQLDDWLKNGLVDRQEYLVLKNRFERDL